jgi:glucokinase
LPKNDAPLYIGIDVGGTNVTGALVRSSGKILEREKQSTPRDGGPAEVIGVVTSVIEKIISAADGAGRPVAAIGLGVPGLVDPEEGLVTIAPNVGKGLNGAQLVEPLEEKFGISTALGNDVNVGIMGEAWMGAARGLKNVVGMFIGTGIGGGIVNEGRLVCGSNHAAGEIGHIIMQVDGPLCGCGNRGCLEALASRTAIERDLRAGMAEGRQTQLNELLGDDERIRSKVLRKGLKRKDPLVTEVMEHAARVIGLACISVQHMLQPEAIVLGGGVIEACGAHLVPIITRVFESDPLSIPGARGRIVESALGDDAGVLGAVALARAEAENGRNGNGHGNGQVQTVTYPEITEIAPGSVVIGGREYGTDIYVRANGKVKKRKRAVIKREYGTPHVIGQKELKKVCKGRPATLIVGTGFEGIASLDEDAERYLQELGIAFKLLHTPNAVAEYNRTDGPKALILHVKG